MDVSILMSLRETRVARKAISAFTPSVIAGVGVEPVVESNDSAATADEVKELPNATGTILPELKSLEEYKYTPPIRRKTVETIRNLLYFFFILFKPINLNI